MPSTVAGIQSFTVSRIGYWYWLRAIFLERASEKKRVDSVTFWTSSCSAIDIDEEHCMPPHILALSAAQPIC